MMDSISFMYIFYLSFFGLDLLPPPRSQDEPALVFWISKSRVLVHHFSSRI